MLSDQMRFRDALGKHVAPWRFVLFFVVLASVSVVTGVRMAFAPALLVAFDVATVTFLVSCFWLFNDKVHDMRRVAEANVANRGVLLVLTFILTVVILAAVVSLVGKSDRLLPVEKGLVAVSLVLIWLFANAVYTLHYCHLYYTSDDGGTDAAGLIFPGTDEPLMSDFVYFAFTIGVAVQTSDVQVTSPHIRMVVTAHCVAGFFFNLGVLALSINVLGSR